MTILVLERLGVAGALYPGRPFAGSYRSTAMTGCDVDTWSFVGDDVLEHSEPARSSVAYKADENVLGFSLAGVVLVVAVAEVGDILNSWKTHACVFSGYC